MISSQSLKTRHLDEMITSAKEGNLEVQNDLIRMYQPYIAKCVSEVCKRYVDPKHDDEFSVGLFAFNEAIQSFSPEKGSSFLSFARLVVKRKVIDYIRFVQKTPYTASLDESYDVEKMENPAEIVAANEVYREEQETWYRREEIAEFIDKLRTYKLTLIELIEASPKHRDARESAISTAKTLYDDKKLRAYVHLKKKLPIKELVKKVDVSKKTLERNRKYILAIFIVLSEDYLYLKDYLKGVT